MNKIYLLLILLFVLCGLQMNAQTFTTHILNKEPFQSAASLTQDYDNDGDLDIIVTRWNPAGIYWLENDETKQFPATPMITENLSFYIADIDMADFDNDGDMDYVVCFTGVDDGELSWFQRLDNGTYQKWTIATNKDFIEADVADFNGDGWIDIAAVGLGNSDETCRVYLNQGNFFFNESIVAQDVGDALDIDDIDGDGDFDIVIVAGGFIDTQTGDVTGSRTLINDGNANFTVGKWLKNGFSNFTSFWDKIEIVDLNGDGTKDFLSFSSVAFGGLIFLDGTNNAPFNSIQGVKIDDDDGVIDLGGHLVVFDIDGNGLLDIVRQGYGQDRISVLYQFPNFEFEREYIDLNWNSVGNPTAKMSIGDLDGDGDIDLIFPEQGGNADGDISWYENINGKLYKHQIYGEWKGIRIPKMVDWDNDGDLDIFATVSSRTGNNEDELILYENIDGINFINWRLNDNLDYAADVEFADIDGDGDLDAFATARDADNLVWLRNDGFQANWVMDTIFSAANSPLGIATDDIDADGDADVVMCSWNDDKVFGFKNDGSGNFTLFVIDANIDGPREVKIADLDNDGDKDIAVISTEVDNSVVIYLNDGSENFIKQILFTGAEARDIDIGDWNQDGQPDIFVGFIGSGFEVVGFINDNNDFLPDTFHIENNRVLSIKLVDLDGDNDLDILTGHDESTSNFKPILIASFAEQGNIVQSIPLTPNQSGSITGIDFGDINNDGVLDIVYADFNKDDLVLITIGCLVAPTPIIISENATCNENNGTATVDLSIFDNPTIEWNNGQASMTITDLESGNYEITITDSNGCTSIGSVSIEEIPIVAIEIDRTNTTCGNDDGAASVNLIGAANITSYQWSNGGNTASISSLAGGVYSVTVTDENDCEIIESIDIESLINPTVNLGDDILIITGQSAVLDATGSNLTYEWSTGETTPSIVVSEMGIYSVTVTNFQGCSAVDEVIVTITTGVNVLDQSDYFNVFPNPTKDNITVTIHHPELNIQKLKLINSSGKEVWNQSLDSKQDIFKVSLKGLPNGLYFVLVETGTGYLSRKVMKL